ncbi:MAG: fibronectin type III domain-containing protein, partial [Microgenomates group bacterium]
MTYSDLYQKSGFKIPSFIAVAIIAGTSFLVSNFFLGSPQSSQAIKSNVITLDASNISATRANVVWRTAEKEIGLVAFGDSKQKLSTVVTDERDTATRKSKYFNHSVLLNNLKPNTQYYFSLTNEKELLSINNKTIFSLQTAALDNRINSLKPAYGTVVSSTGAPERNTLVILRSKGSIALTTISKGSGEWLLPLNGLLRAGNLTLSAPSLTDQVTIEFFDEKGNTT